MADDTNKTANSKPESKKDISPVCDLSIATIVLALHNNALKKALEKNKDVNILNSAISDDNTKIASAGEHIISVIPTKQNPIVNKTTAIEVLKTYVQWFVGPDLASKVNDTTVKSLTEDPLKESRIFKTFNEYLLEDDKGKDIDDSTTGDGQEREDDTATGNGKDVDDSTTGDGQEQEETATGHGKDPEDPEDPDNKKTDEKVESKAGYYIAYNLKVEGLPQTALKDAVKKFAATFFDKVTFTSSSIFGVSGGSFTIKDVKDKFKDVFGAIDPDKLVEQIGKEINDIRHPDTDVPKIEIRDKTTLLSDLGNNIDAAQKQQINQADYSVWILLTEYDPKKKIFNRRVIADIVTSSITGLYKKFKNKVTKNDVIHIENYKNIHSDTKGLEQLTLSVPEEGEFLSYIRKNNTNIATVWQKIDTSIDKLAKNKRISDSELASGCVQAWKTFKLKHEDDEIRSSTKSQSTEKIEKYFKSFLDDYKVVYKKYKTEQDLHESSIDDYINAIINNSSITQKIKNESTIYSIRHDLLNMLFESVLDENDLYESKVGDEIKRQGWTKDEALNHIDELKKISKKNEENTIKQIEQAFSSIESISNASVNSSTDSKSDEQSTTVVLDKQTNGNDLYIVPMPGLKYQDKEYDTYAK